MEQKTPNKYCAKNRQGCHNRSHIFFYQIKKILHADYDRNIKIFYMTN